MRRTALEIWKKIPGLPEYYEVSNFGRIRNLPYLDARGWRRKGTLLKFSNAQISLRHKWYPVAALVLRAFVGPPPTNLKRPVSRHLDDDRSNNKISNLAWGSDQDNSDDAKRNGRSFVSYGHLGKTHSDSTKALLSAQRKGIPTGRKMSSSHRAAIWEGYRKKFPRKSKRARFCKCGCGKFTNPGNLFIHGHTGGRKKSGN